MRNARRLLNVQSTGSSPARNSTGRRSSILTASRPVAPAVTNADILRSQGEVLRIVGGLEEGQKHAAESRGVIHRRLDEQTNILSEVAETLRKTQYALDLTS